MSRLLKLTAIIETVTGLGLVAVPSVVVRLLLGSELDTSAAGILGRVVGGWNLSGIHRYRTGYPFTIYTGDDTVLGGDICGGGELHPKIITLKAESVRRRGTDADVIIQSITLQFPKLFR